MNTAELFNVIMITIFGANYLLFLVGLILLIAIIIFSYRFTGGEAIMVATIIGFGLFASQINPLFTSFFAAIMLGVAVIVALFLWKQFAQG